MKSIPSSAAPAGEVEALDAFRRVMSELGETLQRSRAPEVIAAVKRAHDDIDRGDIVWTTRPKKSKD
jgi:hypothetical protein